MRPDKFLRKEAFVAQPWYNELLKFICFGVCHIPNEYYPVVMEALDRLGYATKAEKGKSDDFTYLYGGATGETEDSEPHKKKRTNQKKKDDMTVAQEILRQLGGREFVTMTGSKDFIADGNTLRMHLAKNVSGANRLFITYRRNPDVYDMRFFYFRDTSYRTMQKIGKVIEIPGVETDIEIVEGAYCDMLRPIFERVTGFDTHMPKVFLK